MRKLFFAAILIIASAKILAQNDISNIKEKISIAGGATAETIIKTKALVTYNDPDLVKKMIPSLQSAAGVVNVKERNWATGAEDFSYYGTKAPPHYTANFYIDESGFKTGIKSFCDLVIDYMNISK